jgi:hypothetical protein
VPIPVQTSNNTAWKDVLKKLASNGNFTCSKSKHSDFSDRLLDLPGIAVVLGFFNKIFLQGK